MDNFKYKWITNLWWIISVTSGQVNIYVYMFVTKI